MGVYLGLNDVNVFGGQPTIEANLQTKSVTVSPTTARQSQIVVPDAGYDGLEEVDISVDAVTLGQLDQGLLHIYGDASQDMRVEPNGYVYVDYYNSASDIHPVTSSGWIDSSETISGYVSIAGSYALPTQSAITITPTTSSQTAVAAGKFTTGAITVGAIPSEYIIPSGNKAITENGDDIDVASFATVSVNVSGGGIGELLLEQSLGTISTTSTSATSTGQSVVVDNVGDYDLLIIETTVDNFASNIHAGTVAMAVLSATSSRTTKTGGSLANAKLNMRYGSNANLLTMRTSTTSYGIYPYSLTVGSGNNRVTFPMYQRYNSSQTGTINASYTTRVYGVKLYELIGG